MRSSSTLDWPVGITYPVVLFDSRAKMRRRIVSHQSLEHRIATGTVVRDTGKQQVFRVRRGGRVELQRLRAYRTVDANTLPPMRGMSTRMSPKHPETDGDFRVSPYYGLLDAFVEGRGKRFKEARAIVSAWAPDGGI